MKEQSPLRQFLSRAKERLITYSGVPFGHLSYRCNICGQTNQAEISNLGREAPSCRVCGSTVRMRALVHLLSRELFQRSLTLDEFPVRRDLCGVGLSDWVGYAELLSRRLNYTNTYYDREPRLDMTAIDTGMEGTLDFIIASDVFEHIVPPVSTAFQNAFKLLKPGGVLIFTVPFTIKSEAREHFPDLYGYEITEGTPWTLKNTTRDGREQVFGDLVFHGGPGSTLEMRVFSRANLLQEFSKAGFRDVRFHREPNYPHGVVWLDNWSVPITARR